MTPRALRLHSALVVLWPVATVVAGAALITRFVRSSGEERLQLKWFAAAAVLVVVTIIPLAEAPQISSRLGLVPALRAQAGKSPVPVVVDADGIGRFGQNIEAAVYFCCLEALQNIAKYAAASHVHIRLVASSHSLRFTVSDDGAGYDASRTPMGSGQRNMADRLAALDGRLEVWSVPSKGTTAQPAGHALAPPWRAERSGMIARWQ